MLKKINKQDKGVAGLTILLSLVTFLFVIGLIIMIFTLMGAGLSTATYTTTTGTTVNESLVTVTEKGENFALVNYRSITCTISNVINATDGFDIGSGNYTQTNCNLASNSADFNNTNWNVTYTYSYEADNVATDVMNDTTAGIGTITTFFPRFVVIGAMIVLILLTVIIIVAIRGSSLMPSG